MNNARYGAERSAPHKMLYIQKSGEPLFVLYGK